MIPAYVSVLIEAALRSMLAWMAVWAGLRLLRVSNVLAQKAAWGLVLVAALAMPALMRWNWLPESVAVKLPTPYWGWTFDRLPAATPVREARLAQSSQAAPVPDLTPSIVAHPSSPRIYVVNPPLRDEAAPALVAPAARPTAAAQTPTPGLAPAASPIQAPNRYRLAVLGCGIYLCLTAALLLRLLCGLGASTWLWLNAHPVCEDECQLAAGVSLRWSVRISSPVNIGSGIVLPAGYSHWDSEKLRIVLAHERSHVRQGDFYLQLLAALYTAVFWFSPVSWWLRRKLSELAEAISDRAGLEQAASRSHYAQVLLEFAALPRPTLTGVAMAHSSNLSHRIERLLNESRFHQAFAGSRRALAVVILVPLALFAATSLIRVQAAAQPAQAAAPVTGQSNPDAAPTPAVAPEPPAAPAAPVPEAAPAPPMPQSAPRDFAPGAPPPPPPIGGPMAMPGPPPPPYGQDEGRGHGEGGRHPHPRGDYSYNYSGNHDRYAVITGPDEKEQIQFNGEWSSSSRDDISKARKMAHGKFLWFEREGKAYIVEDPALMAQIEAMNKPMQDLGKQMGELGRQQHELGKQQEAMAQNRPTARIPTPDISNEMNELNAAVTRLQAKKGSTVSEEELAEVENRIGELQGKLGALQGQLGRMQGKFGAEQGRLGGQQGRLGAEQGRMGREMGRMARENNEKIRTIIDESLKNGKAKPVQ